MTARTFLRRAARAFLGTPALVLVGVLLLMVIIFERLVIFASELGRELEEFGRLMADEARDVFEDDE
ncbi:hypothetical protein [Polymorphobacter sp.]|uniref:hypothetical protein n=1 Tax=Polymorphobacter sp. TaxID=1909290 RepID=UPI003F701175